MINWNNIYKDKIEFTPISEQFLDLAELKGRTALDIGCGEGHLIRQLQARGFATTGIDLSSYAKPDIVGDFLDKNLGQFDVIFANKVIAFNDPKEFIKHVTKHMHKDTVFVLITPVTRPESKYSKHTKSISVDQDTIQNILSDNFSWKLYQSFNKSFGTDYYVCSLNF